MDKPGLQIVSVEEVTEASATDKALWDSVGQLNEIPDDSSDDSQEQQDSTPERASWGGKMEFLMTCIGYAVGLGNVWRFPYLCYKNGGGAFLIPYFLMLAAVGLPLFFMELAFGQFASLGPITIWRINPLLKGVGYGMVIVSWLISLYYNVVIAYVIFYLYASLTSKLPWTTCDNWWNTEYCVGAHHDANTTVNATVNGAESATLASNLNFSKTAVAAAADKFATAAEEYYRRYVLEQTDSIDDFGTLNWKLAACLLIAWVVVGACLLRGVQSLGKVVYFTATFPYLMLTVLLIRGLTLEGAGMGILFYVKPDFAKLSDPRVWSDAATQIFFSLSAGSGGLIAISSFSKFSNNCHRDAIIVAVLNCATSVYAGFVIFSILGFMAYEKGVEVSEVAKQGPGLVFEVYPEALSQLPLPPLWSVFFFLMMLTLGFGSQFSIVECVMSALIDEYRRTLGSRRNIILFRVAIATLSFLLGLPMVCGGGLYLLNLMDVSVSGFPLMFIGLIELVAINHIYGFEDFWGDIVMMIGEKPKWYWMICWKFISPLVMFVLILFNCIYYKSVSYDNGTPYPSWAIAVGWLIALLPILVMPCWFLFKYCTLGGYQLLKLRMTPLPSWGPALAKHRTDRYGFASEIPNAMEGLEPIPIRNTADLLKVLRPEEFVRLLGNSSSTLNTSSLTIATNVGSTVWGSKTSV